MRHKHKKNEHVRSSCAYAYVCVAVVLTSLRGSYLYDYAYARDMS